jgi:hypothetical protein
MRPFLLFFGGASFVGSLLDVAIALLALWIVADGGWSDPALSTDTLLREQLPFIYWVKQAAVHVMPEAFVNLDLSCRLSSSFQPARS